MKTGCFTHSSIDHSFTFAFIHCFWLDIAMKYALFFYDCKYTNYKAVDPILESCKSGPSIHKARWTRTVSQMINDSPHPAQLVISLELSPLKYFRDYPPSCTSSAGKLQLCKVLSVGKKLYLIQDADWQTEGWTEKWTESFLNPPQKLLFAGGINIEQSGK